MQLGALKNFRARLNRTQHRFFVGGAIVDIPDVTRCRALVGLGTARLGPQMMRRQMTAPT